MYHVLMHLASSISEWPTLLSQCFTNDIILNVTTTPKLSSKVVAMEIPLVTEAENHPETYNVPEGAYSEFPTYG